MMATAEAKPKQLRKISRDESATDIPPPQLHIAIMNKDLNKVKRLVQSGASQLHPKTRETPLHVAARNGALECLRWLLDNNVNSPLDKDRDGSTPAHYSAVYGQLEALKELLKHNGKQKHDIAKAVDENGLSILSLATLQADIPMVTWIVDNFPEMGRIKDSSGDLPIHFASAGGCLEIVKLLVKKYGNRYAEEGDSKNITPAYYAAQNGKLDILQYLLTEVKVDSKAREKGGMTIMHAAATGHQLSIVKWLVAHLGPKTILSRSYDGATPLHIAAAQGYTDLLEYFVESLEDTNDINVRDDIQATPAHDAAEFGELNSLLVLLKSGADVTIRDKENKTPYDLAVEKDHTEMISMLNDFREHGLKGLAKYDKTAGRSRSSSAGIDNSSQDLMHRTSQISNIKMEATNLLEKRKDENVSRKTSLLKLNEGAEANDSEDDLERQLMQPSKDRGKWNRPSRTSNDSSSNFIDHEPGPQGELYAVVNKKRPAKKHSSTDRISDVGSQTSSIHRSRMTNGFGDPSAMYISPQHNNIETASNLSRPSRVKHYDYESSSSIGSSVSQKLESGRSHLPGFYPGMGQPGPAMGQIPTPYPAMPPGGAYAYPNSQYPFFPAMVAQYYGYPYPPQPYQHAKAKTTSERMHMEALQRSGRPLYGPPPHKQMSFPGYPMHYPHKRGPPHPRGPGRARPSSGRSSTHSVPVKRRPHHQRDRDIGFGPSSVSDDHLKRHQGSQDFHPLPPPITKKGKLDDHKELQSVDENFIMVQPDQEGRIPTQASEGTQLHRAKIPDVYDGRYDQFIETDSEDEPILDDHISVTTLGECALILALGPISGLVGLTKMRREEKEKVSPAMFAEIEEQRTSKQWSSQDDLSEMQMLESRGNGKKPKQTLQDWSDVYGVNAESLNTPMKSVDQLGGSIRARQFSMKDLKASSLHQSLASLTKDDDEEDDIISVVVGGKKASKSKKHGGKESRKKAHRKPKEEPSEKQKKKGMRMIVKPSKSKEKDKEREMKLRKETIPAAGDKSSGPVEVKNTAIIDSSDSEEDKKKRKKNKKKTKEFKKEAWKAHDDKEFDDFFDETQKELENILSELPSTEKDNEGDVTLQVVTAIEDEDETPIEKLDKMFPHSGNGNDEEAAKVMKDLKNNSTNLTPQQKIRLQVIDGILQGKDLDLRKQLLSLFSDGWSPVDDYLESSSNAHLNAEVETKIMEAQEQQRRETQEHFRTQAQKNELMQQQLQEEMKTQLEILKMQFTDLMRHQLEEQKKLLTENTKQKKTGSVHARAVTNDNSDDSDSDAVELVTPRVLPSKSTVKTMKANIQTQDPLTWENFAATSANIIILPPEPPSVQYLLSEVNDPELKQRLFRQSKGGLGKRNTSTDLMISTEAIRSLTGDALTEESDEEESFAIPHPKTATRKLADVKKAHSGL